MKVNKIFFKTFYLEIIKGKMVEKTNMKIGDPLGTDIQNGTERVYGGTLGGFVITNDESKVYALTCNHIFPRKHQAAYTNYSQEIGTCVFTTREKSCDFAAIEVNKSYLNKCDIVFLREDRKRVNAKLYTGNLSNIGLVYKIGAATDVTKGHILSSEYYDKVFDKNSTKNVFMVHGIDNRFAAPGDSGSLVFARPRNVKQKHVEVVGMIYANSTTIYDDDNEDADNGIRDDEHISFCFRIHTALELFKENQGREFEVRFKDDLSSTSSSSSDSDD